VSPAPCSPARAPFAATLDSGSAPRVSLKPIPSFAAADRHLQALSQHSQMAARRSRPNYVHAILNEDDNETDQQQNNKHDEVQSSGPTPPPGYPTSYTSLQHPYGGNSQSPPGAHGSLPRPPSQPEPISFVPAGPSSPSSSSSGSFAQYPAHEPGGVQAPYTYMTPAGVVHGQVSSWPSCATALLSTAYFHQLI